MKHSTETRLLPVRFFVDGRHQGETIEGPPFAVEWTGENRTSPGTALNDALFSALKRLSPVEGRRAVVVLTDGRDENGPGTAPGSRHTRADVVNELRAVNATIDGIGLGSSVDRSVLKELSRESGGEAFFPGSVGDLADDYRRVIEHLRRRYIVTFVSSNSKRDGSWRDVEITSQDPLLAIRSRGGYSAPGQ